MHKKHRYSPTPWAQAAYLTLLSLAISPSLHAQKTSTWTGNASNDNWTDATNWDTSEDPNGGDTAIIPTPFEVILNANRSLSQLQTTGTTGNFVEISGSSQLTINNILNWENTILSGSGTLISNGQSTISEVAIFDNWDVTLNGFATLNSNLQVSNNLLLAADTEFGTSSIIGSGDVTITGTLAKDVANTSHVGVLGPEYLNINSLISVNSGIISISGDQLVTGSGAQFATNTDGRIRLTADDAIYEEVVFSNGGQMDITDEILGTDQSIEFKGVNISSGTNPVELGANSKFKMTNAALDGKWLMRAAELVGDVSLGGATGGFVWERGQVGHHATTTGLSRGDFLISPTSAPLPMIKGTMDCNGYILQTNGVFTVAEGVNPIGNQVQAGMLNIPTSSTYELVGASSISRGPSSNPMLVTKVQLSDGTLLHSATSNSQNGSLDLPVHGDGTIQNNASDLILNDTNILGNVVFIVDNSAGLDSKIRLSGSTGLTNPVINFTDGGVLAFEETSQGTKLSGTMLGAGNGTAMVSDGTLTATAFTTSINFPSNNGDPEDPEFTSGPKFLVSREDAFSPELAIAITRGVWGYDDQGVRRDDVRVLNNQGNFEWSGGTIATTSTTGGIYNPSDPGALISIIRNNSDDFHILTGTGTTRLQDIIFDNNSGSVVNHGANSSPYLDLRRAKLDNKGLHVLKGDGRITVSGTASESKIHNYPTGIIRKASGTGTSIIFPPLDNEGTIESLSGTLSISGTNIEQYDSANKRLTGGTWAARDGGILRFSSISQIQSLTESAKVVISGSGSDIRNSSNASLFASGPLTVSDESELQVADNASVNIGTILNIEGLFSGNGEVDVPVVIIFPDGTISPGLSPGTLSIIGDLTFQSGSNYLCEIGPTTNDIIDVTGAVTLGGNFKPDFIDGAMPGIGESFTIVNGTSVTGSFDRQDLSLLETPLRFSLSNTGTSLVATVEAAHYTDFASWQAEQFSDADLLDPLISGPDADPDKDGIANMFEHVFGFSPHSPDASPISYVGPAVPVGTGPGTVDISFPWLASITGEQFSFEFSDNLSGWSPATTEILSDVETNDVRQITVRVTATSNHSGQQFFRMAVDSI